MRKTPEGETGLKILPDRRGSEEGYRSCGKPFKVMGEPPQAPFLTLPRLSAIAPKGRPGAGTIFARRYRIERLIGQGGMGRVYLATDTTIDEPIALKLLSSADRFNQASLDQFKRELKLARRIRHRNVVASFHLGCSSTS
jgi:serine/threonine protein kinase